jgi:putative addiction module component (TIGR02574 family)
MTSNIKDIEKKVMELSVHDRALLVRQILHSLEEDENVDEDVEELWIKEAEYRYNQYKKGKITAKPADKVFQDAKANLE